MKDEDRRMQFKIRWEMVQYEGRLYWSRIQTAALIEGAFLTAIYAGSRTPLEKLLVAIFGAVLVFVTCMWAIKDARDSTQHRKLADLLAGEGLPQYEPANDVLCLSGTQWTYVAIWTLCIFNALVILALVREVWFG